MGKQEDTRRDFLKTSLFLGMLPYLPDLETTPRVIPEATMKNMKSIIGQYGPWANELHAGNRSLSFLNDHWTDTSSWQKAARSKVNELLAAPAAPSMPTVKLKKRYEYDGLEIEELSWSTGYGRDTEAVLLKPRNAKGRLPAILALHDHAAKKYFRYRKIVKTSDEQHPLLTDHQRTDYGGMAWANEMAKRGYVVLVHDTFTFGSRRIQYSDVEGLDYGPLNTKGKSDADPENTDHIEAYNAWASEHEHVLSKSLFTAGTTWPGVFLSEDQLALSILCARDDVDTNKVGCGGLSGGGLRTAYLGGIDERIKCAVCVGFMSTWADFTLHKSFTHTWMTYIPLLAKYMDFPEILGMRVPLPTMVQSNNQDELYTLQEMKKADVLLKNIFKKAGAAEKYSGRFYDGEHKFDRDMQADAFAWFDRWLK